MSESSKVTLIKRIEEINQKLNFLSDNQVNEKQSLVAELEQVQNELKRIEE